jgi:vancomycin resistance protein YoaR
LGAALLVLTAAYLGAAWFLGRHVPANTTVAGVPIGGMTPVRAEDTLRQALATQQQTPVVLRAGDHSFALEPTSAGLTLDLTGTVDGLTGFSLRPADLWNHLTGGTDEPLRRSIDRARLEAALANAATSFDTPVVEGTITFPGGTVSSVQPVTGSKLAVRATADVIAARWPASGPIQAKLDVTAPAVSAQEVTRATTQFATPAMSGPVKVVVGARSFAVPPAAYAPAITMQPDASGTLAPVVDNAELVTVVRAAAAAAGIGATARDARITLSGPTPVVVPSVAGTTLDENSVVAAFVPALTSPSRTAKVATTVVQPKLTTAQADKIKPKGVISTFTTKFPYNPPRTTNITIAARTLNGTYVAPNQQFSLNAVLGQRTAAKGYARAPVIEGGRLTTDFGGGVSQVSTTTFNAAFFSGVRIDQFLPHSFYISRYPEGRAATVSWPDVDQTWTNDTGSSILIRASVSGSSITVTFYGTKVWDISSVKGPRRNVVQPKAVVDPHAGCVPQSPSVGFDVSVTRVFARGGKTVKTSTFTTHYLPEDSVTCTHAG